ncbi:MAG TPA: hypothetical protein VKI64_03630, partial [Acidimicrobiales bacterium]|nr:hypothetical protein [Acidimicrobiales bacterium]
MSPAGGRELVVAAKRLRSDLATGLTIGFTVGPLADTGPALVDTVTEAHLRGEADVPATAEAAIVLHGHASEFSAGPLRTSLGDGLSPGQRPWAHLAPPGGRHVPRHLPERQLGVGAGLSRQAEHPITDDVPLD